LWAPSPIPARPSRAPFPGRPLPGHPAHPTAVEFPFVPWAEGTYVHITETGFSGDEDTLVGRVINSTTGFTFLLSSLKAFLEHDVVLRVVLDAHLAGLQI
jgi:hypothetical protein